MNSQKIVVIGNGGREHALCWKLSQSPSVSHIYAIPGNGGTSRENKVENVKIDVQDFKAVLDWCQQSQIDLCVIGPEVHLAKGMANLLSKNGITCFGPSSEAAHIEANKEWSKWFMTEHSIPTARWKSFTNAEHAKNFILDSPYETRVIKASGLAAGKGVFICTNKEEACTIVDDFITTRILGDAGDTLVIEEFLEGEEVSVLAFTDGKTVKAMLPVQDHKRLLDSDKGPNTGGMGAFCPYPLTKEQIDFIQEHILQKTIDGLMKDNRPFVGVLYAGLMITEEGIKVLEFNCRFGDPETQVLMPMLETDLLDILWACCNGTLNQCDISWKNDLACVSVVMASENYPEGSSTGHTIFGLSDLVGVPDVHIFHAGTAVKDDQTVTSGGRVLNVVVTDQSLHRATSRATKVCSKINFTGCQYRTDIARKSIPKYILLRGIGSYQSAGVDIESGNKLIENIKPLVGNTFNSNVLSPLGSFGAVVDARLKEYSHPLLVSGCDGVGTKLKIAQECDDHETIGEDLVAMCVNDILAHGAKPLFFLDYFACGKLKPKTTEKVIKGIANGCKIADCALVGGETAEMPGFYVDNEYDLAGFAVGVVEKCKLLPSNNITEGDQVLYLPSNGIHSNGFSLIRKIMTDCGLSYKDEAPFSVEKKSYGEEFLKPTKIYVREIIPLIENEKIKAFAHITGGGLIENAVRVIPDNLKISLNAMQWNILPVFAWIATRGCINEFEMLRTFNCGVGAIVIVSAKYTDEICKILNTNVIGAVESRKSGESQINVINFTQKLAKLMTPHIPSILEVHQPIKKRVAILISGAGTNMQALIEATQNSAEAQIVLVISSKENAKGLKIAEKYQIPTMVLKRSKDFSPKKNDEFIHAAFSACKIEIICLAGYMHILSEWLVGQWRGKMINIHPSLLPSFRGIHAQRQALESGVKITGCTVHFVEPEVDAGAIIEQASVPVHPDDTEDTLTERIKEQEHVIFPKALKLVASEKVKLNLSSGKIIWKF